MTGGNPCGTDALMGLFVIALLFALLGGFALGFMIRGWSG